MKLIIKDPLGIKHTNDELGFKVHKVSVPELINKQIVADTLPISHKQIVYDEIPQPRLISVLIGLPNDNELLARILAINMLLNENLTIMFDTGPLSYDVRLNSFEQQDILGKYMQFQLTFETLDAHRYSWQYSNEVLEDDWNYSAIGVIETDLSVFDLTAAQTVTCINRGQLMIEPVIRITGSFDSLSIGSLSFLSGIDGELIIDCDRKLCYQTLDGESAVLINQKGNLSGDWISLVVGQNDLLVTGTNLNIHLEVIYRHIFL